VGGTALDTSVIVPAVLAWHEHHAVAVRVVRDALGAAERAIVPVPALVEAFSVLARLPPPWRIRPEDAHRLLAENFREGTRVVGLDGDEVWSLLDAALASQVAGGAIYDAHITACARKAGAARLLTFNRRDFERLDLGGIDLVVPPAS